MFWVAKIRRTILKLKQRASVLAMCLVPKTAGSKRIFRAFPRVADARETKTMDAMELLASVVAVVTSRCSVKCFSRLVTKSVHTDVTGGVRLQKKTN